jgi:hypothetical protein
MMEAASVILVCCSLVLHRLLKMEPISLHASEDILSL